MIGNFQELYTKPVDTDTPLSRQCPQFWRLHSLADLSKNVRNLYPHVPLCSRKFTEILKFCIPEKDCESTNPKYQVEYLHISENTSISDRIPDQFHCLFFYRASLFASGTSLSPMAYTFAPTLQTKGLLY